MPLTVGEVLNNRYRIDALLGQGGMGAVYRAWDTRLNIDVAIKENAMANPASARQFEREARMMARLRHPNLPRVGDHFVAPDGAQYLVMDYIEGEDLGQIIKRTGPLDETSALAWIDRVCAALTYLHSQDPPVIHRDIKPSNIKVTSRGEVFLVDFGIAKIGDLRDRTTTGALGVTPGFSPPEQHGSGGTDARSDIYALGATLYILLTGQVPPDGVQRSIEAERLTPPEALRPDLSPSLSSAISAALAIRPTDRPQTIAHFRSLLTAPASPELVVREPPSAPVKPAPSPPVPSRRPAQRSPSPSAATPAAPPRRRLPKWAIVVGAAGTLVLGGLLAVGIALVVTSTLGNQQGTIPHSPPPTAASLGDIWTRPADDTVMVYIPAGEFEMGSAEGSDDQQPAHAVALDAYWIDRTEVTNGQYLRCVQAGECAEPADSASRTRTSYYGSAAYSDYPVVYVDWNQADGYCAWVGARLPTEAEWEYAARGPDGAMYPWGAHVPNDTLLNYDGNEGDTTEVGAYPDGASWSGALDMAGNVREWTADWYLHDYYESSPSQNPSGPPSGEYRVLRGGGWDDDATPARAIYRDADVPDNTDGTSGFRCARDAD